MVVYFTEFIKHQLLQSFLSSFVFLAKQWNPCIIRIINLKVDFRGKKCALYTGKYGTHISKVIAKGYRTLGFLKQNLRVNPPTLKAKAYTSILHPQLEYCSAVGDPTVENSGSYKLEMAQPWGTRWALGRYQQLASAQLENFGVEKS